MQTAVDLIEQTEKAASVLNPLRIRILERFREPDSASNVAATLGLPRQRVGYHVRALEGCGLLRHVGDRRKGNCVERILQASSRHYVIGPRALGAMGADPEAVRDRYSSDYLMAVAAQTIREVGVLQHRAVAEGKKVATMTLQTDIRFASPADQAAFAEELANGLADLAKKYHREDGEEGRWFRFLVGGWPGGGRGGADAGSQPENSGEIGELDGMERMIKGTKDE